MKNLFIDRFCGIRHINSISDVYSRGTVSAVECKNVELKFTQKGGNIALFSAHGNKAIKDIGKKIVGQFESIQNGISYWFIYAVDEQHGYLYAFNSDNNNLELLDDNLAVSSVCNGITVAQGYTDWFVFTNGIDDYLGVCMTQENPEERLVPLNATDAEGREIRGLCLETHDGRLITACKNRVHWSAQGNIFDWMSSPVDTVTIPAYQEFDRDVTAMAVYNNMLVVFTQDYSVVFKGNPGDLKNFVRSGASGGGCAAFKALIKFDNKLFYYDDKAKNVFAYYLLDSGQTRPSNGYADDVIIYFSQIDLSRLKEIEIISYICGNQSEIWFKIPTSERNKILIYDYLKKDWVERHAQQDIGALAVIRNSLYSAAGNKLLKEKLSSSFDGVYIPSEYKTTIINLNSDSNIKVPKMPLIMTLDWDCNNDFYMEFIYDDMPEKRRLKHIVKLAHGFLIWSKNEDDQNGGTWALDDEDDNGGIWVSSDKNTVMFNLDGVLHFKQLQIRIFTQNSPQEFAIKRLEFKRVGIKNKSLG